MLLYYITDEPIEVGKEIVLPKYTDLYTQRQNAFDEIILELRDPKYKVGVVDFPFNIFDPCSWNGVNFFLNNEEQFRAKKIDIERYQNIRNNRGRMIQKGRSPLHELLKNENYHAVYFYQDHEPHVFLLEEVKCKIAYITTFSYVEKSLKSNLN